MEEELSDLSGLELADPETPRSWTPRMEHETRPAGKEDRPVLRRSLAVV
jgi:hypothetical protein